MQSCGKRCVDFAEDYRPKQYKLVVEQKEYENRYLVISGKDSLGQKAVFKEVGYHDLYNVADKGDTLIKEKGRLEVIIVKRDTSFVFTYECDGRRVE